MVFCSVTENGFAAKSDTLPIGEAVHDKDRVEYFQGYTDALMKAVNEDGVPVKSYFAWSRCQFLDVRGHPVLIFRERPAR
jgi:beta-glucosidase/6-phospho-beta-glucosidase/beta-galactosidase